MWWSTVLEFGGGGGGQQVTVGVRDEDMEVWNCESIWNLDDGHVTMEVFIFQKWKVACMVELSHIYSNLPMNVYDPQCITADIQ